MTILALDTSSAAGSAAIVRDGAVVLERAGDPARTHSERLPRELMTLLEEARLTLAGIDRYAVAIGPGSFTGMRIGIATVQGLALAQGRLVVPVSTFEALRTAAAAPATMTAVWIDAHRGEIYGTLYDGAGRVLREPTSLGPEATLDDWAASIDGRPVVFAGDGAIRHRTTITARLGAAAAIPAGVPALAGVIGRTAAARPDDAVRPHAVVPLYVRPSGAEAARDRRESGSR